MNLRFFHFLIALCMLGISLAMPNAKAQDSGDAAMPMRVRERLWESPGPAQDGAGAPRLLIVYPEAQTEPADSDAYRYAGRVDPPDADVMLNGKALKVWPGGVFTGLKTLDKEGSTAFNFCAKSGDKTTSINRSVRRQPPPTPAPAWPPSFFVAPVSPRGDLLTPPGGEVRVTLYASPGMKAEAKVGDLAWARMEEAEADQRRGGVYKITLKPPSLGDGGRGFHAVSFRLTGSKEGETLTKMLENSGLRVASLAEGQTLVGRISKYLATYLKASSGWERWGNWSDGTPFAIREMREGRARVEWPRGGQGWIEQEGMKLEGYAALASPNLGKPQVEAERNRLTLRWPDLARPVPCVFDEGPDGETSVRISLPGAADALAFTQNLPTSSPFAAFTIVPASEKAPPIVQIQLRKALWGVDAIAPEGKGFMICAWTQCKPQDAPTSAPLRGMRIMIDAGHGGRDLGALGPSGITESDINLVQAAWLEKYLTDKGATVRQMRRDDTFVELDDRCTRAAAWGPDLFISLHHNSVSMEADPLRDRGSKVYFHYPHSRALAQAIGDKIEGVVASTGGPCVLTENFRVIRNVMSCPSVLVETGYLCNPEDEILLRRTETAKKTAQAIATAIERYIRGE